MEDRYLVMAIPEENLESARAAFNDFFTTNLKRDDWTFSIGSVPGWREIAVPANLFVVACFHESQYIEGFSEALQIEAMTHDPSFASFGASADVVEDSHAYLNSLGLEQIPMEM